MFRFSIRELMLVTLVVAVCVAWRLDHHAGWSAAVRENVDLKWKVTAMEECLQMMNCEFRYDENGFHMDAENPKRLLYFYGSRPTQFELWLATCTDATSWPGDRP